MPALWITPILFVLLLVRHSLSDGTAPLYWDAAGYYRTALEFFKSPSFSAFLETERPIFSWLSLLSFHVFGIELSPSSLALTHSLLTLFGLIGVIVLLGRELKSSPWAISLAIALPFSLPLVFSLSTQLLADISLAFSALFLAATILRWLEKQDFFSSCLVLMATALGMTSKPIFLFWMGCLSLALLFHWNKKTLPLPLLLSMAIVAGVFLPKHFGRILQDLYFHNEVLGYWRRFDGLSNGALWFPTVLLKTVPTLILLLIAGLPVLSKLNKRMRVYWTAWGIAVIYVSFFVVSKDERHFLFLIILFLVGCPLTFAGGLFSSKLGRVIGVIPPLVIYSWIGSFPFASLFQRVYLVDKLCFTKQAPELSKDSLESLGIPAALSVIEADCKRLGCKKLSLFVPHSGPEWNAGMVANSQLAMGQASSFHVTASTLRYGGWGADGGFPVAFWKSPYILTVKGLHSSHLIGDTEIYNRWISKNLSDGTKEFHDGLTQIAALPSRVGQIEIYRREKMPTEKSYSEIMEKLAQIDSSNPWNIPLWAAAGIPIPNSMSSYAGATSKTVQHLSQLARQGSVTFRYPEILSLLSRIP
jgi:hypothetical protein